MSKWDKQLNHDFDYARKMLLQTGSIMPLFAIHGADRTMVVGTPFTGDTSKENVATLIRLLATAENATAISFISEAWSRTVTKRAGETEAEVRERAIKGVRPSEAEDRKEIVIVQLSWRDDDGQHTMQKQGEITRGADGKPSGLTNIDTSPMDTIEGRFASLVPPRPITRDERDTALDLLIIFAKANGLDMTEVTAGGRA